MEIIKKIMEKSVKYREKLYKENKDYKKDVYLILDSRTYMEMMIELEDNRDFLALNEINAHGKYRGNILCVRPPFCKENRVQFISEENYE